MPGRYRVRVAGVPQPSPSFVIGSRVFADAADEILEMRERPFLHGVPRPHPLQFTCRIRPELVAGCRVPAARARAAHHGRPQALSERGRDAFGADIDYAVLVKIYGAEAGSETRYSPAVCTGTKTEMVTGTPDPKHISTSCLLFPAPPATTAPTSPP